MRLPHFESVKPICPRCKIDRQLNFALTLANIIKQDGKNIIEGLLHCSNAECQLEFPIIDGVPIIVPNIRQFISENLFHLTAREDLSPVIESVLGDAAGPNTFFDATRQHLSTYCWAHYNDKLANKTHVSNDVSENSLLKCIDSGLSLIDLPKQSSKQMMLDVGCSVGRNSFELAKRYDELVLGIDVNFSMLRIAQSILHKQFFRYPLRRVGIVYDVIEQHNMIFLKSENVDFWCCDALSLPFADNSFRFASSLNVLDAVSSPYDFLQNIHRVVKPDGSVLLTTPFDWSTSATPVEAWLGGHSQRTDDNGASETVLKKFLTSDENANSYTGLVVDKTLTDMPWHLRVHDRHTAVYQVDVFSAKVVK